MEQFEQLLTCCVCLDRYRNPKLLPCQHSFCMEPCMDGLTDYVRRQVKCPECRAEHRIPYNGVQGFPTNVTLQRFLELHIEITGDLPDPTSGQVMERCNVCSEKSYCNICMHCEKKICPDCKSAHMDILRREINRINNQIRRGIHRLQDILQIVEKNTSNLQNNVSSVSEEIDEIYRRLTKAVKDRTDYMRTEMDKYVTGEMKNLSTLKENLELEIANITSNCDLADKYMNEAVEWDDTELMDTKEIFLKTVEFIRNFEAETSDYSRRIRFSMACDPNQLVNNLSTYGDLHFIHPPTTNQSSVSLQPTMSGIMRSKSDHRLATQFRQQQELGYNADDEPLLGGRKFGERPKPTQDKHDSRYGYDYGNEDQFHETSSRTGKNRFRSRFHRGHHEDEEENESSTVKAEKEKQKVTSTEDVAKGPLSGIFRILDSPRAMKKVQECEKGPREKKEVKPVTPVAPVQAKPVAPAAVTPARRPAARQQSEDEIERIKKENKSAGTSNTTTESERPAADTRATSILKKTSTVTSPEESDSQTTTTTRASVQKQSPPARSSSESSSTESSSEAASSPGPASIKPAEVPSIRQRPAAPASSSTTTTTTAVAEEKKPFQSRFLQSSTRTTTTPPKKEESESSSEEESSEEESETEEEAPKVKPAVVTSPIRSTPTVTSPTSTTAPNVTPRTGILKDTATSENRRSFEESNLPSTASRSRYEPASTYSRTADKENDTSRYSTRTRAYEPPEESSYSSRFLNKSKTSAITSQPSEEQDEDSDNYGTGRSRYMALKERRNRLARSRSSHNFGNDDDDMDEPVSPTTASPSAYLASRYGASSGNELSRSRSTHALKSREPSPVRGEPEENKEALSSWARYLKNKYGSRSSAATTKDSPRDSGYGASSSSTSSPSASSYSSSAASSSSTPSSTSSASRRLSLGLPLRAANEMHSSDDDSKNLQSSLASPIQPQAVADGMEDTSTSRYCTPRTQYLQKRRQIMQIGGRGSEAGKFTWPRGICCGPDNVIAVADSSNHRVQVFDANGNHRFEFGTYGNADGEFDCLAGIAINRIGQFIIADRYNHRIQVFDPAGRFLRAFGSQGTADGKFNYPWGITTDSMGFIYVADKENHRIQVFQSDGTFVGKFGSCGSGEGQLEHPHYIAVSNTNRVIVSDSNNHRIQIFDVNGKVLSCFGGEGSQEGEFKFPRGVAVDESGYICVADSGNNRIQIFHPDGSFLRAFGSWGSGEAEFKGLEGVAIMSNGNILVCDRENHRVQIF